MSIKDKIKAFNAAMDYISRGGMEKRRRYGEAVAVWRSRRIMAEFVPQAWVNSYAINVDVEGETTWDVTDVVTAMGKDAALALRDDQFETDELRQHPNAPQWVKNWTGPFYVRVEEAITEYYEEEKPE